MFPFYTNTDLDNVEDSDCGKRKTITEGEQQGPRKTRAKRKGLILVCAYLHILTPFTLSTDGLVKE